MIKTEFPLQEQYDTNRNVIVFSVFAGRKHVACAISAEALREHFGANDDNPMPTFLTNRFHIEHLAMKDIWHARLESDGTILINSRDLVS